MNVKEGLNALDYLAAGINREDPIIKTVISDSNGNGALANELESLVRFINYYTRTDDARNHAGKSLEMIVKLFTKSRRRANENDDVLTRRLLALTYRQGDTIWGNALNVKHVFETYFNAVSCYVAENTNKESMLPDGDFNTDSCWLLDGGATYDYKARFSGSRGLLFKGVNGETCALTIERLFISGNYAFHFMLWGKCGVIIQRKDGKYWNGNERGFSGDVILEWVNEKHVNVFDKPDGWDDAYCFVVLPDDINELTITFISIENEAAFIDHARLYVKPLNSSYTLILQYQGYKVTPKTLHSGVDGDDPIPGLDYLRESYFDSAFIIGPTFVSHSQAFNTVLEKVRPRGIQAFTEFIEKKEREEDS
jgi:hypothetical protein